MFLGEFYTSCTNESKNEYSTDELQNLHFAITVIYPTTYY